MAGFIPAIHVFKISERKDVDGRERRQVYVVCVKQTTMPGHDEDEGYLCNDDAGDREQPTATRPMEQRAISQNRAEDIVHMD